MDPNDKNPSVDDFDNDEYWPVFQTLVGGQSGGFCVVLLVKIVKKNNMETLSVFCVSLSRCSGFPCGEGGCLEGIGLGSCTGKVGQRFQPSARELLKRRGEMMSWTLSSSPPLCFFTSSPSLLHCDGAGVVQQQKCGQTLGQNLSSTPEHIHDTADFTS